MTSEIKEPGMVPADYRYDAGNFVPLWGSPKAIFSPIKAKADAIDDLFIEARGDPDLSVVDDARKLAFEVMRICWLTFPKKDARSPLVLKDDCESLFPPGDWQALPVCSAYDSGEKYSDYASRLHGVAEPVSRLCAYDMRVSDVQRVRAFLNAIMETTTDGWD
tara:strand:+ start:108 stop:596 length:489 start_codon:yes stop_codon:yes gene_type:complete